MLRQTTGKLHLLALAGIILGGLAVAPAVAQEGAVDQLTVPLSDPSRPARLKADLVQGSIVVKPGTAKEVIVEARRRGGEGGRKGPEESQGLRRVMTGTGTGLEVEEANNEIQIKASAVLSAVDLTVQVPRQTSLQLTTVNAGNIEVDGISGEIEVNNVNGGITVTNTSGVVVAHTVNGKVKVELNQVTPDKLMSFSTLNGDIDVQFPPNIKANLKLETQNGSIYSDFDIKVDPSPRRATVEDNPEGDGKYRVRIERAAYGTINGGGPEIQFTSLNGNIYIRKGGN